MKRFLKSVLGVTLLEIMLVLAIAAMVIVMSLRYYQSAVTNQKVITTMNNVTAIVAVGEGYLATNGTFTGITSTNIAPYMPGGTMPTSGWGGAMSIASGATDTTYSINIPNIPPGVCAHLDGLLKQSGKAKMNSLTACTAAVVTSQMTAPTS